MSNDAMNPVNNTCMWLQVYFRPVEEEVVSNNSNKLHQTTFLLCISGSRSIEGITRDVER